MRQHILWVLVLGLAVSASALAPSTSNVFQPVQKPWNEISRQDGVRVTGDTVEDPFIIGDLPFTATGNTCNFINDYDYACPYSGSTSADVVYKWVATVGGTGSAPTGAITVDLCASVYDTKVYVYDGSMAVIACNDDYCSFQSQVSNVPVTAGNAYYIVIDGYGGSCGTYNMTVSEYQPCVLSCQPGAVLEGEPTCYDGYNDTYNGGCNVVPFPVFQILEPTGGDITICGTTGVFPMDTTTYRDTDWYQLDISGYGGAAYICLSGDAEVPCYFFIIDGRGGCSTSTVVAYGVAGPCAPVSDICYDCDPGTWWVWAGPNSWDPSYACGSRYNLTISGFGGFSPVESTTWGRVKGMFR